MQACSKKEDRAPAEKRRQHGIRRYVIGVAGSGRKGLRLGRADRKALPYAEP